MAWRLAKSLERLREQVNAKWPGITTGYSTAGVLQVITLRGIVTGLSPGTAYWFDLSRFTSANTLSISGNVICIGIEF